MALQVWLPLNKDTKNRGLLQNFPKASFDGYSLSSDGGFINNISYLCNTIYHFEENFLPNVWSISVWFRKKGNFSQYNDIILCKNNESSTVCQFYLSVLNYGGTLNIGIGNSSTLQYNFDIALDEDLWYHAAATYDGVDTVKLYFNGKLARSGKATYNNTDNKMKNLGIGTRSTNKEGTTSYGNAFYLNDVRIYDNVLTDDDVKRIRNCKIFDLFPYIGTRKELFFDKSGFGIMPLVNNGAKFRNNYLYFDGTSARVRPSNGNVGFNLSGGTLSVWFVPETIPTDYRIIYIDSTSQFGIGFYSPTQLLVTSNSGNTIRQAIVDATLTEKTLNNVTVSYNGDYNNIICYVNSEVAKTGGSSRWLEYNGLTIGGRTFNNTSLFNGQIYKVDVFKDIMSEEDIKCLFKKEHGMFIPDEYIQIESIVSKGYEYIDTLVNVNPNNKVKYNIIFSPKAENSRFCPFGAMYELDNVLFENQVYCGAIIGTEQPELFVKNAVNIRTNLNFIAGTFYNLTLEIDGANYKATSVSENGVTTIIEGNTTTAIMSDNPGATVQIFGYESYSNGTILQNSIRETEMYLNYFEIIENDIIRFRGIPAQRRNSSKFGLYDTISHQFFENSSNEGGFDGIW